MKVYSWKTLLVSVIVGGALFILELKNVISGDLYSILLMIFWAYLIIKGLWASLTIDGFQSDQLEGKINKTVFKNMFGKYEFIARWGGPILIILAGLIITLIPTLKFLPLILFFLGIIYYILIGIRVRKAMKRERKKYF